MANAQKTQSDGIFAPGNFCIDGSDAVNPVRVSVEDPACNDIQNRYNVSVSFNTSTGVFLFTGTWPAVSGNMLKEQMAYRVYPGAPITLPNVAVTPPSSPPDDDPDGDAFFISTGSCGHVGEDPCPAPPADGEYRYSYQFINQSSNAAAILGCTWDWGDDTVQNFGPTAPECQFGQRSPAHTYAKLDTELPYPDSCAYANQKTYTVTLTMRLDGFTPPPYTKKAGVPYCKPKN
jgi:hypothetical protein